jgi:hypothetical protein
VQTPSSLAREREWEGGRKRKREVICPELLFLYLKGMTGLLQALELPLDKQKIP